MATQTLTSTNAEKEHAANDGIGQAPTIEHTTQQLRALYADAPEMAKVALSARFLR
jgi:hypothetical protein